MLPSSYQLLCYDYGSYSEKDIELVKGRDFAVRYKLDEGANEAAI
ncbi:MAG: hypothetical protein ACJ70V_07030 [Nitrososphaera sp.]